MEQFIWIDIEKINVARSRDLRPPAITRMFSSKKNRFQKAKIDNYSKSFGSEGFVCNIPNLLNGVRITTQHFGGAGGSDRQADA